jgi:hypothetical protein
MKKTIQHSITGMFIIIFLMASGIETNDVHLQTGEKINTPATGGKADKNMVSDMADYNYGRGIQVDLNCAFY